MEMQSMFVATVNIPEAEVFPDTQEKLTVKGFQLPSYLPINAGNSGFMSFVKELIYSEHKLSQLCLSIPYKRYKFTGAISVSWDLVKFETTEPVTKIGSDTFIFH